MQHLCQALTGLPDQRMREVAETLQSGTVKTKVPDQILIRSLALLQALSNVPDQQMQEVAEALQGAPVIWTGAGFTAIDRVAFRQDPDCTTFAWFNQYNRCYPTSSTAVIPAAVWPCREWSAAGCVVMQTAGLSLTPARRRCLHSA